MDSFNWEFFLSFNWVFRQLYLLSFLVSLIFLVYWLIMCQHRNLSNYKGHHSRTVFCTFHMSRRFISFQRRFHFTGYEWNLRHSEYHLYFLNCLSNLKLLYLHYFQKMNQYNFIHILVLCYEEWIEDYFHQIQLYDIYYFFSKIQPKIPPRWYWVEPFLRKSIWDPDIHWGPYLFILMWFLNQVCLFVSFILERTLWVNFLIRRFDLSLICIGVFAKI